MLLKAVGEICEVFLFLDFGLPFPIFNKSRLEEL